MTADNIEKSNFKKVKSSFSSKVGVVLVNWNGGEFTIPCIESLLASTIVPWKIVVVDNGSTDGSPDLIKGKFQEVHLIRNQNNLGFTGANNIGIRYLLDANVDYVWLLNNDTEVHARCLENLLKEHEKDYDVAATTGKIMYHKSNIIWYAGASLSYFSLSSHHRGVGEEDRGQYDKLQEVPFISGCCMMIRQDAFEKVGLLDDHFFIYSEDLDWCIRAKKEGLRLCYVHTAIIYHKISASIRKNNPNPSGGFTSPLAVYCATKNRFFIIRKHSSNSIQFFTSVFIYGFFIIYYSLGLVILRRRDKLVALFKGIRDGVTMNIGNSIVKEH